MFQLSLPAFLPLGDLATFPFYHGQRPKEGGKLFVLNLLRDCLLGGEAKVRSLKNYKSRRKKLW